MDGKYKFVQILTGEGLGRQIQFFSELSDVFLDKKIIFDFRLFTLFKHSGVLPNEDFLSEKFNFNNNVIYKSKEIDSLKNEDVLKIYLPYIKNEKIINSIKNARYKMAYNDLSLAKINTKEIKLPFTLKRAKIH